MACGGLPTAEDERRLEKLKTSFEGYEFAFEGPVYLSVRSVDQFEPSLEDLHEIFKLFWLDPEGTPRADSSYVYLNAYDKEGTWKLQLYWDPLSERVVESREQEHY